MGQLPAFPTVLIFERPTPQSQSIILKNLCSGLRAREGECELGTLAIGKRCQERISAIGWRGSGHFAESALDTLYVARNRGRIDIIAF
jgi:hypothetical protein